MPDNDGKTMGELIEVGAGVSFKRFYQICYRGYSIEYPSFLIINIQCKHTWLAMRASLTAFKVYLARTLNKILDGHGTENISFYALCGFLVFSLTVFLDHFPKNLFT